MTTGNRRKEAEEKGFWKGGAPGHTVNKESGGRKSGSPGRRTPSSAGIKTDLERPAAGKGRP